MNKKPGTILTGARPEDPAYGAIAPPLWLSDTYRWADADTKPPFDYARTVNPNRDMLGQRLAELEGAAGAVITNSGQSAALLVFLTLPADALVIAPHDCYGGTYRLLAGLSEKRRLRVRFVDLTDTAATDAALAEGPALVWIESPSNPLLRLTDITDVATRARAAGARVTADNTLPSPLRQRPLELGCDMVVHSTTKVLNGHGDHIGGAVLAADPAMLEELGWWANAAGLTASAQDAWTCLRGLRTLEVRLDRQEASARRIAAWLGDQPGVHTVHYPGLAVHPDHELAGRQQAGPGFMIAFRLRGAAPAFLAALRLVPLASSLGGLTSLICQPSTMTHRGMPPEAQLRAGIHPDLLRLSVGLEDADDLIADLASGLAAASA